VVAFSLLSRMMNINLLFYWYLLHAFKLNLLTRLKAWSSFHFQRCVHCCCSLNCFGYWWKYSIEEISRTGIHWFPGFQVIAWMTCWYGCHVTILVLMVLIVKWVIIIPLKLGCISIIQVLLWITCLKMAKQKTMMLLSKRPFVIVPWLGCFAPGVICIVSFKPCVCIIIVIIPIQIRFVHAWFWKRAVRSAWSFQNLFHPHNLLVCCIHIVKPTCLDWWGFLSLLNADVLLYSAWLLLWCLCSLAFWG